ncbi:double-stranded RNA-binding protein Staufen homolog 2-like [Styela clava]
MEAIMNNIAETQPGTDLDKPTSPVAVIQELGKSRSLKPVFQIIKEEGPPHETNYEVMLTLGNYTWQGEGRSVKKAQFDASRKALEELGYPLPRRSTKKTKIANPASLTPTVILNGLAMARGETVKYAVVKTTPLPCQPIYNKTTNWQQHDPLNWAPKMYYGADLKQPQPYSNGSFQTGIDFQKYNGKPIKRWIHPQLFRVEVVVGERSFFGEGKTQQAARHDAAQHALDVLQTMPVPIKEKKSVDTKNGENSENGTKIAVEKSPISLLYEKASNHGLKVDFTVTSEEGPPHLKLFTMNIKVFKSSDEIVTMADAQGPNKHTAKKKSASAALEKLQNLSLPEKKSKNSKNSRSNIKKDSETKIADILVSKSAMHPISRLTQILQAKKEPLPVYSIVAFTKDNHLTYFCIKCAVGSHEATGDGKSKKEAKRNASENMLKLLGFDIREQTESIIKVDSVQKNGPKLTIAQQRKLKNKPTEPEILPTLPE